MPIRGGGLLGWKMTGGKSGLGDVTGGGSHGIHDNQLPDWHMAFGEKTGRRPREAWGPV